MFKRVLRTNFFTNNGLTQFSSNPYVVLGVKPHSSSQEIKMAYYKLAQQFHPDKNAAKDASRKFSEINEAYEILSDDSKRRMYDSCHKESSYENYDQEFEQATKSKTKEKKKKTYQKSRAASYEDYKAFFDEYDTYFQKKHGKKQPFNVKKRGEDIKINIDVSFKDSIFGTTRIVQIDKMVKCTQCQGTRADPDSDIHTCYSCGGTGCFSYQSIGELLEVRCEECDGWGKVVKCPCTMCKGKGVNLKKVNEEIHIPHSIDNGQLLRKQYSGNASNSKGENGDLIIKINVINETQYKKDGHDIVSELPLTISEAVLGAKKVIDTIWGKIQIDVPPSSKPSQKFNIPQMGIKYGDSKWKKGDHVLVLKLQVPREINQETRELFYEIYKTNA